MFEGERMDSGMVRRKGRNNRFGDGWVQKGKEKKVSGMG